MLRRLLLPAVIAALILTPAALSFPEPTGVDGEDSGFWSPFFGGDTPDAGTDDEADLDTPVLTPDGDGGWSISLGPIIVFVNEDGGSSAPEQWGDSAELVLYCFTYGGLDAICGGGY